MNYPISTHVRVLQESRDAYAIKGPYVDSRYQGERAGTWAFGLNSKRKGWSMSRAVEEWKRQEGI